MNTCANSLGGSAPSDVLAGRAERIAGWPGRLARGVLLIALFVPAVPAIAATPDGTAAASAAPAPLVDIPCDIPVANDEVAARLRCATLRVLRDPLDPGAGAFGIAVVIRRSITPKAGAAPVLFLHGGPGGAMTSFMGRSTGDFLPGHDLVAFDMRGGGRSTPKVCTEHGALLAATFASDVVGAARVQRREAIVAGCRADWQAAGFATGHFGTDRNVADAEALREALGVPKWLLFGESYGTAVAAHYLARHPDRIEAAVLDSLYPADAQVLPTAEMQGRLVDRIAADCRRDAACAARWPDFGRQQMEDAVSALDAEPLVIPHRGARYRVDGLDLRRVLMGLASFEAGARSLPILLDAAMRRDGGLLLGPVLLLRAQNGQGGNLAAMYATDCRDRARHHGDEGLTDPVGLLTGLPGSVCRDWAEAGPAPLWPVGTTVPTLILSGGYDVFQPDAAGIAATLGPSVRHVEIPVASHGARGAGTCARDVIAGFLAAPSSPPDTACVATMPAPSFVSGVRESRGPVLVLAAMAQDQRPELAFLFAPAGCLLSLLVAAWATWKRRHGGTLGWTWVGTAATLLPTVGIAAFLGATDAFGAAEWIYGLPPSWAWLPWLVPLTAVSGAIAVWRGRDGATRLVGVIACLAASGLAISGWSPLG